MQLPQGVKMTPMLEQYVQCKKQYPDCLLFFRVGDFYEMFFDDAYKASSVLDIVLTSRSKDPNNAIPMAGIPYHAVDSYLGRLIAAGYRVAICEQTTEPDGKTLVERSVTRIVTPGTWLPENSDLDAKVAACFFVQKNISVAFLTSGSGTLRAGTFQTDQALSLLSSFSPNEIIIPKGQMDQLSQFMTALTNINIVERERSEFTNKNASSWLCRKWGISTLNSMGFDDTESAVGAAYAVVRYLEETQFSQAKHITSIKPILSTENLILDQSTQINLELVDASNTSLYFVLNRCATSVGKKLLKDWILSPLQDIDLISLRQKSIGEFINSHELRKSLEKLLLQCSDMAKSIGRMTLNMGSPSDLLAIKQTLRALPEIKKLILSSEILSKWATIPDLSSLSLLLNSALSDEVPRFVRDGGVVRSGFDKELDEWRERKNNSSLWLSDFEEKERKETGIKSLKIGVNKIFGYYIEIPKGSVDKAPLNYTRKQTLVGGERYITEELKLFEKNIFRAEEEILILEEKIYAQLVKEALAQSSAIQLASNFIATIDVLLSLADVAFERGYVCPVIDRSRDFIIKGARHPVIEIALGKEPFTPNDYNFTPDTGQRIAIITGPNMAGKSTYLRMAALITIMSHMGSYVPVEKAKIGLVDRVFTRIGARDELARGQSTFMVEMVETANILRYATDRSLIVLDEVGRGTSTYDGLSIAWSVLEFLHGHENRQARVLFATHYHELTQLPSFLPGIVNLSMAVEETSSGITFLHKVVLSPSDKSYGIEVARLAGIPTAVLRRSKELLKQFESESTDKNIDNINEKNQMTLFDIKQDAILEELASVDPDSITPMQALELIYRLKKNSKKALEL
ncbi:MAG: DNA mismatch repair protein MutS [Synergistaceae bacterium]|nr:DNA mismatch repair protein MutS [Synergistaceae bacterium]